jgi:hypothetical protein
MRFFFAAISIALTVSFVSLAYRAKGDNDRAIEDSNKANKLNENRGSLNFEPAHGYVNNGQNPVWYCISLSIVAGNEAFAATHMLTFEGDSHIEWFEGNFADYEEDKKRRLGIDSVIPHRLKYKKFSR